MSAQTSDHAPMIGTRAPDHDWKPPKRRGVARRPWAVMQRQSIKVAERDLITIEIAEQIEPEHFVFECDAQVIVDREDFLTECGDRDWYAELGEADDDFDDLDDEPDPLATSTLYGDAFSWQDLQSLTITNTPYLWSR